MKLVLHAGPHKTGSTALQSFLFSNRDALKQCSIIHPAVKNLDGNAVNQWWLVYAASTSPERAAMYHNSRRGNHDASACARLIAHYRDALKAELKAALAGGGDGLQPALFVLSTEEIAFLTRQDISNLYSLCLEYCSSVEVIYYYRSPLLRIRSDVQQAVKGGQNMSAANFESLACQDMPRIQALLPDDAQRERVHLSVRAYRRDLAAGSDWDVRSDFCEALQIDSQGLDFMLDKRSQNATMSLQMFACARKVNQRMPQFGPDRQFNQYRRYWHYAIEDYAWGPSDTPFRLSARDSQAILRQRDLFRRSLEFWEQQSAISMDPCCWDVFNSMERQSEDVEPGVLGSIFDHEPDVPADYYINLICHFWSYLRRIDLENESRLRKAAGAMAAETRPQGR